MAQTTTALNGVTVNEVHTLPDAGQSSSGMQPEAIEFVNLSSETVDLEGWELWGPNPDFNSPVFALKIHTFKEGDTIPPGGYFTIIDSSGNPIVPPGFGAAAQADVTDTTMSITNSTSFALHAPDIGLGGTFIMFEGAAETQAITPNNVSTFLTATHPNAVQSGPTEKITPGARTGESAQRSTDGDDTWVQDDPNLGEANCFAAGTLVATPNGETPVESLAYGDVVVTADGQTAKVLWIGVQTLDKRFRKEGARLVRIAAGTVGNHTDLYVTGEHGIYLEGYLIDARVLVNGGSVDWVSLEQTPVQQKVYHVETDRHCTLFANGAAAESFVDYQTRGSFDNYASYVAQFGEERGLIEMRVPRISTVRALPNALRARFGPGMLRDVG